MRNTRKIVVKRCNFAVGMWDVFFGRDCIGSFDTWRDAIDFAFAVFAEPTC